MPGGIGDGEHVLLRLRSEGSDAAVHQSHHVVGVAAAEFRGVALAGHVPARRLRDLRGEGACLDVLGDVHLALEALALDAVLDEAAALHGHRGVGGQALGQHLVLVGEDALAAVEDLRHAHHHAVVIEERDRQDGARAVAGALVDGAVEALVRIRVRDVDDALARGGRAGNARAHRYADDARCIVRVADPVRHLREELVGPRVELEDRGAVGVEQVAERVDDRGQDRLQVAGGGEPPRKLDELLGACGLRPAVCHQPFGSLAAGAAIWPPLACG